MKTLTFLFVSTFLFVQFHSQIEAQQKPILFPTNKATNVSPDTHLKLIFNGKPILGNSGKIKVYDASNDSLIDVLDLSIPAGPTESVDHKGSPPPYLQTPYEYNQSKHTNANTKPGTPSCGALPNPDTYQLNIIGGFTDAFHFYPVIIHDSVACIYLHNNLMDYNKTYYVLIDSTVIYAQNSGFKGIYNKSFWTFSTKKEAPSLDSGRLTVNADGTGDFNTVQGAVDFIPDFSKKRTTIFIRKGDYEELVYFRNKSNITFLGENKYETLIHYANNEVFNPHPINISTNEWPGTFPSRRAAFMADNSQGVHIVNLTIKTDLKGQAEGLLIMGKENIVYNADINGSGDALQINGSAYLENCYITGDGDTYLGRGPVFFDNCRILSKRTFAWIRNTNANHGAVFFSCTLACTDSISTDIARAPTNNGTSYSFCEAVLINCSLFGISPIGWGSIGGDVSNVHYWEFHSINESDGQLVDISKRHPASKQLDAKKDAETIKNYSNPVFVFDGWKPEIAPIFTTEPIIFKQPGKKTITISIQTMAMPEPTFQWFKDGKAIIGENKQELTIKKMSKNDVGTYTVEVKNNCGSVVSDKIELSLKTNYKPDI